MIDPPAAATKRLGDAQAHRPRDDPAGLFLSTSPATQPAAMLLTEAPATYRVQLSMTGRTDN